MDIGHRVATIRREAKLNQQSFAELIGASQSAVSDVETGKNNPSFDLLAGIAKAFPKLSLSWLLSGTGSINRPEGHDFPDPGEIDRLLQDEPFPLSEHQIGQRRELKAFRHILRRRATDRSVSQSERWAYDRILAALFADNEARRRMERRERRSSEQIGSALEAYRRAEVQVAWQPPSVLRNAISGAMLVYGLSYEGAVHLLEAAKIVLKKS